MKKTLIIAAAIICALAVLAGCTITPLPPDPTPTPTPAAPTATPDVSPDVSPVPPTSPEPTPTPEPTPSIPDKIYATVSNADSVVTNDDGVEILITDTDSILVKSARSDVSDAIAAKLSELDDEYNIRLGELRSSAFAQYDIAVEDGTDGFWTPYGLARQYAPARVDENAVSIVMTLSENTGGPHPNDGLSALNFDAGTGELLTLRDVCAAGDHSLEEHINSRLAAIGARCEFASDFYEGWEETLSELVLDDVWYFDDDGITIIVNRYIVAPYVYGPQFITVPYGELTSLLKPEYMPPVREDGEGDLLCTGSEPLGVSSINRLVIDEAGKKFFFSTDGVIYNVRVNRGWSSFDTFEFYPGRDLYSVNRMTKDDCIQISTYIPEILPDLMVSYVSDGVEKSFMVLESGEDGHVYLSPRDE